MDFLDFNDDKTRHENEVFFNPIHNEIMNLGINLSEASMEDLKNYDLELFKFFLFEIVNGKKDNYGNSYFHNYTEDKQTKFISYIIKQFKTYFESKSINPRNCKGETPLIIAIKKGNLELVKLFLDNGMDYTIPIFSHSEIFNGRKTSIEIVMENDQIEIVHEILNKFFNDLYFKKFNLLDRKIFPFLFYLIEINNEDIIKFILNKFIEELSQNNFYLNNRSIFELLIKTSRKLNDENIIKSISNIFEKDLTENKFYLQNI